MRYAVPIITLAAFLVIATGCGRGTTSEPATIGEVIEEVAEQATPGNGEDYSEGDDAATIADEGREVFTISDQSYIGWAGTKPLGTHFGQFPNFAGVVTIVGDDITTAKADITFYIADLTSDDTRLTGTLLNQNWFHADEYPLARFVTTSIEPADAGYKVNGNLSIRGTTESVSFPAEIDLDGDEITVFAEFPLDRTKWGVGQGLADNLIVRNDVAIELDVIAERSEEEVLEDAA